MPCNPARSFPGQYSVATANVQTSHNLFTSICSARHVTPSCAEICLQLQLSHYAAVAQGLRGTYSAKLGPALLSGCSMVIPAKLGHLQKQACTLSGRTTSKVEYAAKLAVSQRAKVVLRH